MSHKGILESDHALKLHIMRLQEIQRTNPPTSEAWQTASAALAPLFAEMARRFPAERAA